MILQAAVEFVFEFLIFGMAGESSKGKKGPAKWLIIAVNTVIIVVILAVISICALYFTGVIGQKPSIADTSVESKNCLSPGADGKCAKVCTIWKGDTCTHSCTVGVPCD